MIRIAICDDEAPTRAYLASLIRAQNCPCEIIEYPSANDCLADYREIDLLFLDIELNTACLDGMGLARQIREGNSATQPVLIFVTGYERYVFDAFDVQAFQYLLKPIDEEKFFRVLDGAIAECCPGQETEPLVIRVKGIYRNIPRESILYAENEARKVVLHLKEEEISYYAKMSELEGILGNQFFRCHRGYLVYFSAVRGYDTGSIQLKNGETILMAKQKYSAFVAAYMEFLRRK